MFFLYRVIIMLKLRLKRVGRRHDPSFRVVVTENTTPPKGKYLEAVGFYNARLKQIKLDADRIRHWLSVGAQPTDTVHNLLIKEGVVEGTKIAVHSTKLRKKEDEVVAEKTPTEEASTESVKAEETASGDETEKKEEVVEASEENKEDDKKDATEETAQKEDKEETPTDSTQDAPQEKEEEKPAAEVEEAAPAKSDEKDTKDEEDTKESSPAEENKGEKQD